MLKIITTEDGSRSLLNTELNETYHSVHGAYTESMHVYIHAGISYVSGANQREIKILEVGLGTGLNLILTYIFAEKQGIKIYYHALEPYPVAKNLMEEMAFQKQTGHVNVQLIDNALGASFMQKISLGKDFSLFKEDKRLLEASFQDEYFDLVYYDAFAPNKQPEMWNEESLAVVKRALKEGGVLVTYCAQGQFRRNLRNLNFSVESIPGPPGKKEMTRAIKTN